MTGRRTRRLALKAVTGLAALTAGGTLLIVQPVVASGDGTVNETVRAYAGKIGGFAMKANVNVIAGDDPGLSVSYGSTQVNLDTGSPPILIDAHALNNDPGTLAGAAIYQPGGAVTPENTPGYAEAFYPQPADRTTVRKCAINNEQKPADECKNSGGNYYAEALADPFAQLGPTSSAFASSNNTMFGDNFPLSVGNTTTTNLIGPDDNQELITRNVNTGSNITIPGQPIEIKSFEARSDIVATYNDIKATASCTVNVAVNGQDVPVDQVQAALGQLQSPGVGPRFEFTPPTAPTIGT